ncbi:MAG: bifunctional precorrin-2 dehydrogenase/sirohydrochlorin ferrochelatase [Methanomicrobiaceae archaeon]|nr:bifunctional precorrin-2 dehydrogenase/sirohydrochlorin ferrochelatase [Methanomicrobiaceae archaeon]
MIPLIHDLRGKSVTIFGGGRVALRKASFFHPEASVTVVSRTIDSEIIDLGIKCISGQITPDRDQISGYIGDSSVVVAATSDKELNNAIGAVCREKGIMFNNADGEPGDIMIPSVVRGDNYMIAISTEGKSPAVPRYIRQLIERECRGLDEMIAIQSEFREVLKTRIDDQEERNRILRKIVEDGEVWSHLENNKRAAMEYITRKYLK